MHIPSGSMPAHACTASGHHHTRPSLPAASHAVAGVHAVSKLRSVAAHAANDPSTSSSQQKPASGSPSERRQQDSGQAGAQRPPAPFSSATAKRAQQQQQRRKQRGSIFSRPSSPASPSPSAASTQPSTQPPPAQPPNADSGSPADRYASLAASIEGARSWPQLLVSFMQAAQLPDNHPLLLLITRSLALMAPSIADEDVEDVQRIAGELMNRTEAVLQLYSPIEVSTLFKSFLGLGVRPTDTWLAASETALLQPFQQSEAGAQGVAFLHAVDVDDGLAVLAAAAFYQACGHTPQPAFVTAVLQSGGAAWTVEGVSPDASGPATPVSRMELLVDSVVLENGEEVLVPREASPPPRYGARGSPAGRGGAGQRETPSEADEAGRAAAREEAEAEEQIEAGIRPVPADCLVALARAVPLWDADPAAAASDAASAVAAALAPRMDGDVAAATAIARAGAAQALGRWRRGLLRASQLALAATARQPGAGGRSLRGAADADAGVQYEDGVRYDLTAGEMVDVLYGVLAAGATPDAAWVRSALEASRAMLLLRPRPTAAAAAGAPSVGAGPGGYGPSPPVAVGGQYGGFAFGVGAEGLLACRSLLTIMGSAADAAREGQAGRAAHGAPAAGVAPSVSLGAVPGTVSELSPALGSWVGEVLAYCVDALAAAQDDDEPSPSPSSPSPPSPPQQQGGVGSANAAQAALAQGPSKEAQEAAAIAALLLAAGAALCPEGGRTGEGLTAGEVPGGGANGAAGTVGVLDSDGVVGAAGCELLVEGQRAAAALAVLALPEAEGSGAQGGAEGRPPGAVELEGVTPPLLLSSEGMTALLVGVHRCGLLSNTTSGGKASTSTSTSGSGLGGSSSSSSSGGMGSARSKAAGGKGGSSGPAGAAALPPKWLSRWCSAAVALGGSAFSPADVAACIVTASRARARLDPEVVLELSMAALRKEAKAWAKPSSSSSSSSPSSSSYSPADPDIPKDEGGPDTASLGLGAVERVRVLLRALVQYRRTLPETMLQTLMQLSQHAPVEAPAHQGHGAQGPKAASGTQADQGGDQSSSLNAASAGVSHAGRGGGLGLLLLQASCLVAADAPAGWLGSLMDRLLLEGCPRDAGEAVELAAAVGQHGRPGAALMPQVQDLCLPFLAAGLLPPSQVVSMLLAFATCGHVPSAPWWKGLAGAWPLGESGDTRQQSSFDSAAGAAAAVARGALGGADVSKLLAAYCALRSALGPQSLELPGGEAWYHTLRHHCISRVQQLCGEICASSSHAATPHREAAQPSSQEGKQGAGPQGDRAEGGGAPGAGAAAAGGALAVLLPGLVVSQEQLTPGLCADLSNVMLRLPGMGGALVLTSCLDLWALDLRFQPPEPWLKAAVETAAQQLRQLPQPPGPARPQQRGGATSAPGTALQVWAPRHVVTLLRALAGAHDTRASAAVLVSPEPLAVLCGYMGRQAQNVTSQEILSTLQSTAVLVATLPPRPRQQLTQSLAPVVEAAAAILPSIWHPLEVPALLEAVARLGIRPGGAWLRQFFGVLLSKTGASDSGQQPTLVVDRIAGDHQAVQALVSALDTWGVQYAGQGSGPAGPGAGSGGADASQAAALIPLRLLAVLPRLPPSTAASLLEHLSKQSILAQWLKQRPQAGVTPPAAATAPAGEQAAGATREAEGAAGGHAGEVDGGAIAVLLTEQAQELAQAMVAGRLPAEAHAAALGALARLQQLGVKGVAQGEAKAGVPDVAAVGATDVAGLAAACQPYLSSYPPEQLVSVLASLASLQPSALSSEWLRDACKACDPAACPAGALPRLASAAAAVAAGSGGHAPLEWLQQLDRAIVATANRALAGPAGGLGGGSGGSGAGGSGSGAGLGSSLSFPNMLRALAAAGGQAEDSEVGKAGYYAPSAELASALLGLVLSRCRRERAKGGEERESRSVVEATALAGLLVTVRETIGVVPPPTKGAGQVAGTGWVEEGRMLLQPVVQMLDDSLRGQVEAALVLAEGWKA